MFSVDKLDVENEENVKARVSEDVTSEDAVRKTIPYSISVIYVCYVVVIHTINIICQKTKPRLDKLKTLEVLLNKHEMMNKNRHTNLQLTFVV